ncbi:hypothetical protein Cfor_05483 [Coptotermes formosanus]|uniref:Uncharacterized protein n=1 Tax=Coptotermes formosanus TaxID=36987 RepID=A0A6L2PTI8_COPFO|nr:hypothetical protein Cfor_05483 [Coptotermes formosanus]
MKYHVRDCWLLRCLVFNRAPNSRGGPEYGLCKVCASVARGQEEAMACVYVPGPVG